MKSRKVLICISLAVILKISSSTEIEQITNIFGPHPCIKGSLLSMMPAKKTETITVKEFISKTDQHLKNISRAVDSYDSEKTAMSKLNELAQFNEIDYFYRLIKEEGPPHNKLFTVSLTLGNEEFVGQGSSLKKAQQNVATIALEKSEYNPPLIKEKEKSIDTTTPTVLLNNLGSKLAISVEYFLVNKDYIFNSNSVNEKPKKSYLQKLNESMYSDVDIRKEESQTRGPFKVAVQVGDLFFYGTSHTIQSARHEAASKAINHLIKVVQDGNSVCLQEGSEDECKQAKANLKSPISLVYESAQLRNLNVEFEIIEESGPPHKRVFITECRLGHLSTTGEGKSKKESKKTAAANMLEHISELPEVSQEMYVKSITKDKKNKKNKKKNKVLKTNFDIINMHVDNLISSVKDYGFPFKNNEDAKKTDFKSSKPKQFKKSYQDGILELSNTLNFEVQFMDFNEEEQFYTLLSLHINPEHICLGQGSSSKIARNKAAKSGLKLLQNIDLEPHFKNRKLTLVESEVKQKINMLLKEDMSGEPKESRSY